MAWLSTRPPCKGSRAEGGGGSAEMLGLWQGEAAGTVPWPLDEQPETGQVMLLYGSLC